MTRSPAPISSRPTEPQRYMDDRQHPESSHVPPEHGQHSRCRVAQRQRGSDAQRPGYLRLEVEYERPVLQWNWEGPVMTKRDEVRLCPVFEPSSEDLLQNRRFEEPNGVTIEVSFYWPPYPKGPTAGYTAPLARWVETRISGYTSEPIVLRGEYSQTYRPEHHNFAEHFLFEPQVEPGLSPPSWRSSRQRTSGISMSSRHG